MLEVPTMWKGSLSLMVMRCVLYRLPTGKITPKRGGLHVITYERSLWTMVLSEDRFHHYLREENSNQSWRQYLDGRVNRGCERYTPVARRLCGKWATRAGAIRGWACRWRSSR
ncbi:MAG: hypothetical protein M2R46_03829 [Verrucomicrobia subdivision 3 bacterium]|nr:hypothetical protein [Limisphaerales bacterium]